MRSFVLAAALFGALGCTQSETTMAPPPTSSPAALAVTSIPSGFTLDPTQHAICPIRWTCDSVTFYPTVLACRAACGAGCFREFDCSTNCLCP